MTSADFDYCREKIFHLAGISLSNGKLDLVQSRLKARVSALQLSSISEYVLYLKEIPPGHEEWESFINILTTNKTDWFREADHFEYLTQVFLPKWKKLGKKHLTIWCAASSTGEEPYTLSLVLHEALKGSGITYEIFASDIDTKVLTHAQNGVYQLDRLEQVPEKYHYGFMKGTGEIANWMKVKKEIKKAVSFHQVNLNKWPFAWSDKFDLIMCRNVLIYFGKETIQGVIENLYKTAESESVLIIAHSESLQNIKNPWKYLSPSIYCKGKVFL